MNLDVRVMRKKSVLAIGLNPAFADAFGAHTIPAGNGEGEAQLQSVRDLGVDVGSCLIDIGEKAEDVVTAALTVQTFDCVMIGAGVRAAQRHLLLFEKVINLVHMYAPNAKLCFNTSRYLGCRAALDMNRRSYDVQTIDNRRRALDERRQ
jgi:hypothetical protein